MTGAPDAGPSRALLIGAGGYAALPALPAAVNNALALRDVLTSDAVLGVPPENCRVVLDPRARLVLSEAVREAAAAAQDTLLIYYSGHGIVDPEVDGLHLAAHDSDTGEIDLTALPYEWINRVLKASPATRRVIILDCCFSGLVLRNFGALGTDGTYILTATSASLPAHSPVGETHSAFSGALLQVLREGIPGAGPCLTLGRIYQAMCEILREAGRPQPRCLDGNGAGSLPFVGNPAHGAVRSPPLPPAPPPPQPWWRKVLPVVAGAGEAAAGAMRHPFGSARRAVTVALCLAAVVALGSRLWWPHHVEREVPPKTPVRAAVMEGDPRTADPCALLSPTSLSRFGDASIDPAYGAPERCDVLVKASDGEVTDVNAEFALTDTARAPTGVTRFQHVRVTMETADGSECDRDIGLPGGFHIAITAKQGKAADRCALADAVTDHAVDVLNAGPVPRRSAPSAASLMAKPACSLLDRTALGKVAWLGMPQPEPGFAGWSCAWDSDTAGAGVQLRFDLGQLDDLGQPTVLGGRRAYVLPANNGPDDCGVVVVHRVTDADGGDNAETVRLDVSAGRSMTQLCDAAKVFGTAVAGKLADT
ncbi:caspase family protein [Streptomyces sp. SL13]|uniref:Caspase family protein n=1 Tax=Streptantibioticus silvisoli TaxID=2705255 RepID=A0AA90H9Y3_9ACTN|nr:caspase family protein [Streptantibioticus silvisoli]MDI5970747.1 caspase family protein [Streptantibioticus silvisoli]